MKALTWTKKRPTKPGWYWVHIGDHVYVTGIMPQRAYGGRLCGKFAIIGFCPIDEVEAKRWAGPIPEPKETTK